MKRRKTLSFAISVALSAFGAAPAQWACAQSTSSELVDSYYFTTNEEGFVSDRALITGQPGAFVQPRSSDGRLRLASGVISVATRGSRLDVQAGSAIVSIPPNSTVTLANDANATVICANQTGGSSVGITDGGTTIAQLQSGQSYPRGTPMLQPVTSQASVKKPLFVVAGSASLATTGDPGTIALVSGKLFCYPARDIKINTFLGVVTAGANSQFVLSVMPGEVRVLNCRGGNLQFNHGSKFRRIPVSEEFAIFDHRPTKEEVLPADGIGRKEITLHDVDGRSVTSATTTFSVVTLLKSPAYLGGWKRRSAIDRRLEAGIIRTAAAIATANPSGEGFYQTPNFRNTTDR